MHAADTFASEDGERDEYGRTNPSGSFKCRLSRLQARFQRNAILCVFSCKVWSGWGTEFRKYMQPCMLVAPFWAPSRSPDNKEEETTRLMHFMNVRWARRQNKNRGARMNGCDTMSTVSGCWRWNEGYGANGSKPSKQAFVNCKVWSLVLHRLVLHWHAFQYWVHSIYAAAASTLIRLSKYAIDTYLYKSLYFLY